MYILRLKSYAKHHPFLFVCRALCVVSFFFLQIVKTDVSVDAQVRLFLIVFAVWALTLTVIVIDAVTNKANRHARELKKEKKRLKRELMARIDQLGLGRKTLMFNSTKGMILGVEADSTLFLGAFYTVTLAWPDDSELWKNEPSFIETRRFCLARRWTSVMKYSDTELFDGEDEIADEDVTKGLKAHVRETWQLSRMPEDAFFADIDDLQTLRRHFYDEWDEFRPIAYDSI